MKKMGVGFIGCGYISDAYFKAAQNFPILDIRGVASRNLEAAKACAKRFGLRALSVEDLLSDPGIEIIVNLTTPSVHVEVGLKALDAGKHVYSEKPLALTTAQAATLLKAAQKRGLRVGCAPDTFLGGGQQACRKLIDDGAIGQPVGGTAIFMCPGHEHWHPNPAFYYATGGGPMLDMGPYYITALVNLIGPVAHVTASTSSMRSERLITSEPLKGTKVKVEVATHVAGTLQFACGALVSIVTSFDVIKHRHAPMELYGTAGSLSVPDPNRFGGAIQLARAGQDWVEQPGISEYADGNFRSIGVADMANAIRQCRPHLASGELAFHVLEVMEAFESSSKTGRRIKIKTRPKRPPTMTMSQ